uniref:Piezo_RRas_bdg domain-containing protein n=1 Tax=Ascaris lumbricoides TaxID=6252 RepID=A0A0M3IFD3_ASCLU
LQYITAVAFFYYTPLLISQIIAQKDCVAFFAALIIFFRFLGIVQFCRVSRPDQSQYSIPTITCSETVSFRDLIRICDLLFPNRKHLEPIVDRVFERFVSQVIYKVLFRSHFFRFLGNKK